MRKTLPKVSERYTSYHSDDTFSIFDRVWGSIKRKWGFSFEHNGIPYSVKYTPADRKWTLFFLEPMYEYLMPWSPGRAGTLTEFSDDAMDEFISTFEIEGKTIEWIINHQKVWKYKLSAEHLERVLTGFSFFFLYRKIPCGIFSSGQNPEDPFDFDGRYVFIRADTSFDPTLYSPSRPAEKPWFRAGEDQRIWDFSIPDDTKGVRILKIGPFKTDGELLDTVRFNGKTLRELFDTEYDDREVLCGEFDG